MKRLILIRHGETGYTRARKYCGHKDVPLNKVGRVQSKLLRSSLAKEKIDKIYSSDLRRAYETARIVFGKRRITRKKELREMDFGVLNGLVYEEAQAQFPDIYSSWLSSPMETSIPGGERMRDFAKRVNRCFNEISHRNSDANVAILSHGGPIRVILLDILGWNIRRFAEIEQGTAAINIIEYINDNPTVVTMNDTSHLRDNLKERDAS